MATFIKKIQKNELNEQEIIVDKENPFIFMGWDLVAKAGPGYEVAVVKKLLKAYDLPDVACDIQVHNAAKRALRTIDSDDIRVLKEDAEQMIFQITKVSAEDDSKYGKIARFIADAHIIFNKKEQTFQCSKKALKQYVEDKFQTCSTYYKTHDVTKMLLRIFVQNSDILPLRAKGGAYVVPSSALPFAEKCKQFIKALNKDNTVTLFKVKGDAGAMKDLTEVFLTKKTHDVKEFREELLAMQQDEAERNKEGRKSLLERPGVKKTRRERLAALKKKIALWKRTLNCEAEELDDLLAKCDKEFKKTFGGQNT